jgi:predicted PurR-regulated permease PerM
VLTPPLLLLRRINLPRVIAVGIVVGAAFAVIFALGWLLSREVTQLAADLPSYRYTLSEKIKSLRESTASSPVLEKAGDVLSDLQNELATPAPPEIGTEAKRPDDRPIAVEIQEREPTGFELYQRVAGTLLPPLATAGIVLLFVVFILLSREDLLRSVDQAARRHRPATRHDDDERCGRKAQPLLFEPDRNQFRLRRLHCP